MDNKVFNAIVGICEHCDEHFDCMKSGIFLTFCVSDKDPAHCLKLFYCSAYVCEQDA